MKCKMQTEEYSILKILSNHSSPKMLKIITARFVMALM